jgi:hypothetical protein
MILILSTITIIGVITFFTLAIDYGIRLQEVNKALGHIVAGMALAVFGVVTMLFVMLL